MFWDIILVNSIVVIGHDLLIIKFWQKVFLALDVPEKIKSRIFLSFRIQKFSLFDLKNVQIQHSPLPVSAMSFSCS